MLKLENIHSGYNNIPVIEGITLNIENGEFVGMIGPNGSGKTTLARTITKIIKPSKGKVYYKDGDIEKIDISELARDVAFMPQEMNTVFSISVYDIVMMGRFPHIKRFRDAVKKDHDIVNECLRLTEVLNLSEKDIDEISSGERQRVLIAKALAQEPKLLILDEPTSKLDIGHQVQIMDLLRKFNRTKNITIIAILHDLNIASDYCKRLILLNNGRLEAIGTPEKIIESSLIEKVYKTPVYISESKASNKPHITLRPAE